MKGGEKETFFSGERAINIHDQLIEEAKQGNLPKVKALVKQGENVLASYNAALCGAAVFGNLPVVKYLVEQGASLNDALHLAEEYKELHVVEYLKSLDND